MDERGREARLKYVLRPPIAQERVTRVPEGLVRIALKKRFTDGTFAVDLDPLALHAPLYGCAAAQVAQGAVRGGARVGEQAPSAHPARASRKAGGSVAGGGGPS